MWLYLSFTSFLVNARFEALNECGIPPSPTLDCVGMPEWEEFRLQLNHNADRGYPLDPDLYTMAYELFSRYYGENHSFEAGNLHYQVCRDPSDIPADGFCLYGFIGAMLVLARYQMTIDLGAAYELIQLGVVLLGREFALDFLHSSSWPFSLYEFLLNLNQTNFTSRDDYFAEHPVKPPQGLYEEVLWNEKKVRMSADIELPKERKNIVVLGTHATLALEAIYQIRYAGLDFDYRIYGLNKRWCERQALACIQDVELEKMLVKASESPFEYSWDKMEEAVEEIYLSDPFMRSADLILCTEPVSVCLMVMNVFERNSESHQVPPMIGYFGISLLYLCPPMDVPRFWETFDKFVISGNYRVVMASNAPIVSEQFYYQSGYRFHSVRPHSFYTNVKYNPITDIPIVWRSTLNSYPTFGCVINHFQEFGNVFHFVSDEVVPYEVVAQHKAVVLLPWDTATMTFYEFYSMGIPLFVPDEKLLYQFTHMRGQLTVGELWYRSVRPGHEPYLVENVHIDKQEDDMDPSSGLRGVDVTRRLIEERLKKASESTDFQSMKADVAFAYGLAQDMNYFVDIAMNRTGFEDSYTSMGNIRRSSKKDYGWRAPRVANETNGERATQPYSPFQMTAPQSNDYFRKLAGLWWVRRGVPFDSMRYYYQFSDFDIFPGIQRFSSIPDLLCKLQNLDTEKVSREMGEYNDQTYQVTRAFWQDALRYSFSYDEDSH